MGEKSGIWSWLWVHKIVLTGGLPPPRPPAVPGGPAAPSQIFARLRLSSSPFFWYQDLGTKPLTWGGLIKKKCGASRVHQENPVGFLEALKVRQARSRLFLFLEKAAPGFLKVLNIQRACSRLFLSGKTRPLDFYKSFSNTIP